MVQVFWRSVYTPTHIYCTFQIKITKSDSVSDKRTRMKPILIAVSCILVVLAMSLVETTPVYVTGPRRVAYTGYLGSSPGYYGQGREYYGRGLRGYYGPRRVYSGYDSYELGTDGLGYDNYGDFGSNDGLFFRRGYSSLSYPRSFFDNTFYN